ncbi:MAG TPA: hypothetical protein VL947_12395 [Cytophagales bacterium]|nr:hypothetical protein [Cytophagales bacterium]
MTKADITSEKKSNAVAVRELQSHASAQLTSPYQDAAPWKLKEMAHKSPRVLQLSALQAIANNSQQAQQAARLQAKANHPTQPPLQREKDNKISNVRINKQPLQHRHLAASLRAHDNSNEALVQLSSDRDQPPGLLSVPMRNGAEAALGKAVVQRQLIKLTIRQRMELKIERNSFAAYLEHLGFTFDGKNYTLDTKESTMSFEEFKAGYHVFKSKYEQAEKETLVSPEDIRAFGEQCVTEEFTAASQINKLVQIGKNNFGIYQIILGSAKPLIVKVLGPGYSEKSLKETSDVTNALKKRYAKSQKEGMFEINTLMYFKTYSKGPLMVTLAVFEEQGVMTLRNALLHQELDIYTLVRAAAGLADRTARFHFAPIVQQDFEDGRYLFHGDLNTSNIMLDLQGIMGLIDIDSFKKVNKAADLMWDISSLMGTMRQTLIERYPPEGIMDNVNVFERMKEAFHVQYIDTMEILGVPEKETIKDLMKK